MTVETNENINDTLEEKVETEANDVSEKEIEEKKDLPETEELLKKYNDLYDKYLRTLAEYDNYKKRTQKEKDELFTFVAADTVGKLLPVVDSLERALSVGEESSGLFEGVGKVVKQCEEIFEKMGVTKIEAKGCEFDPNIHNAVMHVEDENVGANIVVEELMCGYKYKDKVIRYSMVKVAN